MAYVRKTVDRWDIESNYGDGWGVECSYYDRKEAYQGLREYRENVDHYGTGRTRLVKRREKVNQI